MKKNALVVLALVGFLFCFAGCDKIYKELTMKEKTFKLPVVLAMKGTGEEYRGFDAVIEDFNLDNEIFDELQEYRDKPIELVLNSVSIRFDKIINTTGGDAVRNLRASASDAGGGSAFAEYASPENQDIVLENGYSTPELTAFFKTIVTQLQRERTMDISVGGETNMVPETEGESGIILGNIVVTMKIYGKIKL